VQKKFHLSSLARISLFAWLAHVGFPFWGYPTYPTVRPMAAIGGSDTSCLPMRPMQMSQREVKGQDADLDAKSDAAHPAPNAAIAAELEPRVCRLRWISNAQNQNHMLTS